MTAPVRPDDRRPARPPERVLSPDEFAAQFRARPPVPTDSPDDFVAKWYAENQPKSVNGFFGGLGAAARRIPMDIGSTMQAVGGMTGFDALTRGGRKLEDYAAQNIPKVQGRVPTMKDIEGWEDAGSWAASAVGQAVASSVPALAGGAAGMMVAGPPGAIAGAFAGIYPQVAGGLRRDLEDPNISPADRDAIAVAGGLPLAALESVFPVKTVGRVLAGTAGRGARKLAANVVTGAIEEGTTEVAQEGAQMGMVAAAGGHKPTMAEAADRLLEAGAAGAVGGAAIAGAGTVAEYRPKSATEREAAQILSQSDMAGTAPSAGGTPPAAESIAQKVRRRAAEALAPELKGDIEAARGQADAAKAQLEVERERRNVAEREANVNPVTGLPNRRPLEGALQAEGQHVSVLDLNGFKSVNDTLGHEAGDELLKQFAAMLQSVASRHGVRPFHPGGDEFTLIGPTPEAIVAARDEIESIFGVVEPAPGVKVSVSGGVGPDFALADRDLLARKPLQKSEQGIAPRGAAAPVDAPVVTTEVATMAVQTGTDPVTGEPLDAVGLSRYEAARVEGHATQMANEQKAQELIDEVTATVESSVTGALEQENLEEKNAAIVAESAIATPVVEAPEAVAVQEDAPAAAPAEVKKDAEIITDVIPDSSRYVDNFRSRLEQRVMLPSLVKEIDNAIAVSELTQQGKGAVTGPVFTSEQIAELRQMRRDARTAADAEDGGPTVTWKKATIVPTREGIVAVPQQEAGAAEPRDVAKGLFKHWFRSAIERLQTPKGRAQYDAATPTEKREMIGALMGLQGGGTSPVWHDWKGGKNPRLDLKGDAPLSIKGKDIVALVDEILAEGSETLSTDEALDAIDDVLEQETPAPSAPTPAEPTTGTTRTSSISDAGEGASAEDIRTLVTEFRTMIEEDRWTATLQKKSAAELRDLAGKILGRPYSSGTWQMDDVYDALEGAVNEYARNTLKEEPGVDAFDDIEFGAFLEKQFFSGRTVSVGMAQDQQFSTPLTLALAAQNLAQFREGDVILEPTAGTGSMVVLSDPEYHTVRVNELSTRRRHVLEAQGYEPTGEDALRLAMNGVRANVVVMNPPYGNIRRGQYTGFGAAPFKASDVSQRFVAMALESLPVGGRLVAVLPSGTMGAGAASFRQWLETNHSPRAYIGSFADAYLSRGAKLDTVTLVVDKGKPAVPFDEGPVTLAPGVSYDQWTRAIEALVADPRFARWGDRAPAKDVKGISPKKERSADAPRAAEGSDASRSTAVADGSGREPSAAERPDGAAGDGGEPAVGAGAVRGGSGDTAPAVVADAAPRDAGATDDAPAADVAPVVPRGRAVASGVPGRDADRAAAEFSPIFIPFVPDDPTQRNPHPRLVVETRSMAGMPAPKPSTDLKSAAVRDARDRSGAEGGLSDEQVDMVRRVTTAWDKKHGFLIADDVGVGKAREAGALVLEAIAQGAKRILYTSKNRNNIEDAVKEFRNVASGSPTGDFPAMIVRVSEYKSAGKRSGRTDALPMPTDQPVLYVLDSYNFDNYAESLGDVRLDTWIADEAHAWKGADNARGMSWTGLHKEMLDRGAHRFAYLTATPAVSLDEMGYLYGLRDWPVGGFARWVDSAMGKVSAVEMTMAAQKAMDAGANAGADVGEVEGRTDGTKRKAKFNMSSRDVYAQHITPAETEQVMREMKGRGKYLARDLWRGGVEFGVQTVDLLGDDEVSVARRARYDRVAAVVREIQTAARKFGYLNKKVKTTGAERALIQGYVKQLTFDLKLDQVLADADKALERGEQVVISVNSVTGDTVAEEGVSVEDANEEFTEGNTRLIAAINRINTQHVEKQGRGDEAVYVELGEIPEALMVVSRLKETVAALPPLRDPVRTIEDHFGAKNVAVIIGLRSPKQRAESMGEFQAGERRVALISAAGKTGISLHDVNGRRRNLLVADYEWSADTFKQELGRVDRTGQQSNPRIQLYASNLAPEARFSSNIAALMSSLGAVSKGSAESTGTDALDQFDLSDGFAKLALEQLWREMPSDDKQYFVGRAFIERKSAADGGYEHEPKSSIEGAEVRQFFLELMGFPIDVSQRWFSRWMQLRDALRSGDESGAQQARRTTSQRGEVKRKTPLVSDPSRGTLTLYEVEAEGGDGDGSAIVQGFVTQHIEAIQDARRGDGPARSRRYVRFTDATTGEIISGLELNRAEARRVRSAFVGGGNTALTVDEAVEALALGEDVPIRGDGNLGRNGTADWKLHPRRLHDGRLRYEIVGLSFSKARDALRAVNGASIKAETGMSTPYVYIESTDVDSVKKLLEVYKPRVVLAPRGPGMTTLSVTDPITAAVLLWRSLRDARARAEAAAEPLVTVTDEEIEARIRRAEAGVVPTSVTERAKRALADLATMGRHFRGLDAKAGPREARTQSVLLEAERSTKYAQARAYNLLWQVTDGLTPGEVKTLTRYLALRDVQKDIERGLYREKELPFGFREESQVETELAKLESAVDRSPAIYAAAGKRADLVQAVTQQLVANELLHDSVLEDERYFHRQVLAYMELRSRVGTGAGDLRVGTRGYQKGRVGGGDFNLKYQEAEFEWLAQALRQLHTKKLLDEVKGTWNEQPTLKTQAKLNNKRLWQNSVWGPLRKALEAKGVPEDLIEMALAQADPDLPFRTRISMGADELAALIASDELVLPASLARAQEEIASAVAERRSVETPDWFKVVAYAAGQPDSPAAFAARTILKAINDRETAIRSTLGRQYVDPRDAEALLRLAPEGYTTWQPVKGSYFYTAVAVEERVLDEVLGGDRTLAEGDTREVLALGGPRETWIIPTWLAETLDTIGKQKDVGPLEEGIKNVERAWKAWTLNAPHRTAKYNINNLFGDGDAAMLYPGIFGESKQSARDLWAHFIARKKDAALIREMEELTRLGVVDNTMTVAEIPDVSTLPAFERLVENNPRGVMALTMGYAKWVRQLTQIRENILRVAAYRWALAQYRTGRKDLYGATPKGIMDALRKPEEKAAAFARDLLGDYQAISSFGMWARDRILPFFSWFEVNGKRYINVAKNIQHEGGGAERAAAVAGLATARTGVRVAALGAKTAVLANAFLLSVALWNMMMFPEEDELLRRQGITGRLILGRDHTGALRTVRAEGAFADFLNWFGLGDYPSLAVGVGSGDVTWGEVARDAVKAPINRIVNAWEPISKMAAETIFQRSAFPSVFEPRVIRERESAIFRMWGVETLWKRVTGRPVPPNAFSPSNLLLYRTDPGEAAYWISRDLAREWNERRGKEQAAPPTPRERDNALFYYRQASKWNDEAAADRWLTRYYELGGTREGALRSLKVTSAPLSIIPLSERPRFRAALVPRERALLEEAEAWWRDTYREGADAPKPKGMLLAPSSQ